MIKRNIIKELFDGVSVKGTDIDQLLFLKQSRALFIFEPLRYWYFYVLVVFLALVSVIIKMVFLAYSSAIVISIVFIFHNVLYFFFRKRFVRYWKSFLEVRK